MPRHIKRLKIKNKEKILKATREDTLPTENQLCECNVNFHQKTMNTNKK